MEPAGVKELLGGAGFGEVEVIVEGIELAWASPEAAATAVVGTI